MNTDAIRRMMMGFRAPSPVPEKYGCVLTFDEWSDATDQFTAIETALASKNEEITSMHSELRRIFGEVKPHHGLTWFGAMLCRIGETLATKDSMIAELEENDARFQKCFVRIAKAYGLTTPLELVANAVDDDENYAEILARMIEEGKYAPTCPHCDEYAVRVAELEVAVLTIQQDAHSLFEKTENEEVFGIIGLCGAALSPKPTGKALVDVEMLKEMEWAKGASVGGFGGIKKHTHGYCPVCHGKNPKFTDGTWGGHKDDCKLAAKIAEGERCKS